MVLHFPIYLVPGIADRSSSHDGSLICLIWWSRQFSTQAHFLQSFSPQGSFPGFSARISGTWVFSVDRTCCNPTFAASQVIVLKAWATSALCHVPLRCNLCVFPQELPKELCQRHYIAWVLKVWSNTWCLYIYITKYHIGGIYSFLRT